MKKIALCLSFLAGACCLVPAQVSVEVTLDQEQFLPGEAVLAAVRISNRSGQPLRLGVDEDWLTFTVESKDGSVIAKRGETPVKGEFVVDSSRRAIKRVDLAPYFALGQAGRYSVIATVKLKDWGQEASSPEKSFNVIEGARLWEQEFGLPASSAVANGVPEVRKYILQQANYLKGQLRLYVRVTDASGNRIFNTVPVGNTLSFSQPDPRIDKASNLHLLYQNWAHSFSYTVFNPNGEITSRQVYDFQDAKPRFNVDRDGNLSVIGGVRRAASTDAPAVSAVTEPPKAR